MAQIDKWLTPEGLAKIGSFAKDGLTNKGIAACMGVSRRTLQGWIRDYAPIAETIKTNREAFYVNALDDLKIKTEIALLKKAVAGDANAKRLLMIMYTKT